MMAAFGELAKSWWRAWCDFWFTPADPLPLAAIRIGTCSILLYSYVMALPDWADHYGPLGWIDQQAARTLYASGAMAWPSTWSLWMLTESIVLLGAGYAVFLVLLLCGIVGFKTRWVLPCAWICHVSLVHRGMIYMYGVDLIGAMLLFYLSFAPAGDRWSLDQRRRAKRGARLDDSSLWANIALRCIQVQLCVVYASAGLSKLAGPKWWSGTAVWFAAMTPEMWSFGFSPKWLFGSGFLGIAIVNFATYATLVLEIAFPFLIWNPRLRPALICGVSLMHLGTGLLMSLGAFAAMMCTSLMAFAPASTLLRTAGHFVPGFRGQRLGKLSGYRTSDDQRKQAA